MLCYVFIAWFVLLCFLCRGSNLQCYVLSKFVMLCKWCNVMKKGGNVMFLKNYITIQVPHKQRLKSITIGYCYNVIEK